MVHRCFRHEQSAGHQKRGGNDGRFCISSSNAIALAVHSAVHFFSPVQIKSVEVSHSSCGFAAVELTAAGE